MVSVKFKSISPILIYAALAELGFDIADRKNCGKEAMTATNREKALVVEMRAVSARLATNLS